MLNAIKALYNWITKGTYSTGGDKSAEVEYALKMMWAWGSVPPLLVLLNFLDTASIAMAGLFVIFTISMVLISNSRFRGSVGPSIGLLTLHVACFVRVAGSIASVFSEIPNNSLVCLAIAMLVWSLVHTSVIVRGVWAAFEFNKPVEIPAEPEREIVVVPTNGVQPFAWMTDEEKIAYFGQEMTKSEKEVYFAKLAEEEKAKTT